MIDVVSWIDAILQGVAPLQVCISNQALQALVASTNGKQTHQLALTSA